MSKYFNSTDGPVVYNAEGNIADGYSWFETSLTDEVRAALSRRDIFKLDSDGNIIYDSIEDTPEVEETAGDEPLTPENAAKTSSSK